MPTGQLNPIDAHVGARIREERMARGLTMPDLAAVLGVTYQQVQKYEKGANRISAAHLFRLARFLKTPIGDFFPED